MVTGIVTGTAIETVTETAMARAETAIIKAETAMDKVETEILKAEIAEETDSHAAVVQHRSHSQFGRRS